MKNDLEPILAGLASTRAVLRSGAFHDLLQQVWHPVSESPGVGRSRPGAEAALRPLVDMLGRSDLPERGRQAFVLGLLAEATETDGSRPLHEAIQAELPVILDALRTRRREQSDVGEGTDPFDNALLYLVAHFPAASAEVLRELTVAFGETGSATQAANMIFATAESAPERSQFVLTLLGSEACHEAGSNQLQMATETLVCPSCHGELAFNEDEVRCAGCVERYGWEGDIPDLVQTATTAPSEFP